MTKSKAFCLLGILFFMWSYFLYAYDESIQDRQNMCKKHDATYFSYSEILINKKYEKIMFCKDKNNVLISIRR